VARELSEVSGATTAVAVDSLRYFLLREVTFGLDGSFSWRTLLTRFNADLANDLGNLLNRMLPLVDSYLGGEVPQPGPGAGELADDIERTRARVEREMAESDFSAALEAIWELVGSANKFLDTRQPWTLHKQSKQVELAAVLYDALDCTRVLALMVAPFMPKIADEIWQQLGLASAHTEMAWRDCRALEMPSGITIEPGRPIFPRVDLKRIMHRFEARSESEEPDPDQQESDQSEANTITIDRFAEVDLRVGTVVEAYRVPGADRLLRLIVDLGEPAPRQIVAGIAEKFNPRELLNTNVVVVANLAPAVIHGVESRGMILAAGAKQPEALIVADGDCPPGTIVR
jgi:methionyl-tRNA synthetase